MVIRKLGSLDAKAMDGEVGAEKEPDNLKFLPLLGRDDSLTPQYEFKFMGPIMKGG